MATIIKDFSDVRILDRLTIRYLKEPFQNCIHVVQEQEVESSRPGIAPGTLQTFSSTSTSTHLCHEITGVNFTGHQVQNLIISDKDAFPSYPLALICEAAFLIKSNQLVRERSLTNGLVMVMLSSYLEHYEIANHGKILREEQLTHGNSMVRGLKYE